MYLQSFQRVWHFKLKLTGFGLSLFVIPVVTNGVLSYTKCCTLNIGFARFSLSNFFFNSFSSFHFFRRSKVQRNLNIKFWQSRVGQTFRKCCDRILRFSFIPSTWIFPRAILWNMNGFLPNFWPYEVGLHFFVHCCRTFTERDGQSLYTTSTLSL